MFPCNVSLWCCMHGFCSWRWQKPDKFSVTDPWKSMCVIPVHAAAKCSHTWKQVITSQVVNVRHLQAEWLLVGFHVSWCLLTVNRIIPHSESLKMTRSWEKQRSVGPETYALVKFMCVVRNVRVRLESVASANVLQLLRDFGWCSVQLLCHTFLLVRVHAVKLLTQISINHILEKMTEFVFVILKYFLINRFRSWNYIIKIRRMCKNNPNLDWEVVGSKAEMVSATKRRKLWAHMHL